MDAILYLAKVEARAKELYAMSAQGEWSNLHPNLQAIWIKAADEELRDLGEANIDEPIHLDKSIDDEDKERKA